MCGSMGILAPSGTEIFPQLYAAEMAKRALGLGRDTNEGAPQRALIYKAF